MKAARDKTQARRPRTLTYPMKNYFLLGRGSEGEIFTVQGSANRILNVLLDDFNTPTFLERMPDDLKKLGQDELLIIEGKIVIPRAIERVTTYTLDDE